MTDDPTGRDAMKLEWLKNAVVDATCAQWTIYRLKGEHWSEVARAPSEAIQEALDTAYRLGRQAAEREDDGETVDR